MRFNQLIVQAPAVSEIGLGAWQLGVNSGWKGLTDEEAKAMIYKSLDLGINFFDTAPNYGLGSSEARLGKALKTVDRDKIVINTKFGHTDTGNTNYSADYIRKSLEGSLTRLQMDYVDSLIIHNPPFAYLDGNKNDHYEILEQLKKEGKIKAYGASLDTYEEAKLFVETTGGKVVEAFYNIFHQDIARAFELMQKNEVGIIVKIPLDSGWLTGKYNARSEFSDIRSRWSREDIKTRAQLVGRVKQIIGPEYNVTQAAIAFCLAHKAVATVIPGNTSLAQLANNIDSATKPLPAQLVDQLKIFYDTEVKRLNLPW